MNKDLIIWGAFLVILGAFISLTSTYYIDDSFIGYVYLRNIYAGKGFVFYEGGPVTEGVSNIGWLITLLPFADSAFLPFTSKILGGTYALIALILTHRITKQLLPAKLPEHLLDFIAISPALLAIVTFEFLYFSTSGMEVGFMSFLGILFIAISLKEPESLYLPLLGSYLFLTRPEGILVFPLYVSLRILFAKKVSFQNIILFTLLISAITAIRYIYFGDILPNTSSSKKTIFPVVLMNLKGLVTGGNPHIPLAFKPYWQVLLITLLLGVWSLRKELSKTPAILSLVLTGATFMIYAPFDWTGTGRYAAPYILPFLALCFVGIVWIFMQAIQRTQRVGLLYFAFSLSILAGVISGLTDLRAKFAESYTSSFPGFVLFSDSLKNPSLWMGKNLTPDSVLATRRIGTISYYTGLKVFDYSWGLTDPDVPRLIPKTQRNFGSPSNPLLRKIWKRVAPEYLLEDDKIIARLLKNQGKANFPLLIHDEPFCLRKVFPISKAAGSWVLLQKNMGVEKHCDDRQGVSSQY